MASNINQEKTKRTIALILENIRTEADADLLEEYIRIFKKEVSLFHRSAAAAYLLMLFDQGKAPRAARGNSQGAETLPRRTDKRPEDSELPRRRTLLAEEESRRLFFSAGRSRRVFPREILGLINTKTAIPREDIGAIRILENYSFVQVRDTVAEQIIEALNGIMFRGRPLTVNYAKSRRDGDDANENGADADADAADTYASADAVADTGDADDAWDASAGLDEYAESESQEESDGEDDMPDGDSDSEQRQDQAEKEGI
ncbi:MAG: DbpA RNA binding domain-containing protein [Treponema sp.]|nr:DbpA RNA binding domain-containing protein [Treponema sp.]